MQLFQSWKQSLLIFKPQNLKLFLLVTLKSIVETYKTWLMYWGWLLILILLVGIFLLNSDTIIMLTQHEKMIIKCYDILSVYILFLVLLSARSSIEPKKFHYFMKYHVYLIYFLPIAVAYYFLPVSLTMLITHIVKSPLFYMKDVILASSINYNKVLFFFWINSIIYFMYAILFLYASSLYGLFILDTDGHPRCLFTAGLRACKMIIYNIPFLLLSSLLVGVMTLFAFFIVWIVMNIIMLGSIFLWGLVFNNLLTVPLFSSLDIFLTFMFILPVQLCFLTNFYIKRVHDQFDLYFPINKG